MEQVILQWLHHEAPPSDLYLLLGRARLDPNRSSILAEIAKAQKSLWPYQNHQDKQLRERALALLQELGRADAIFSSRSRLQAYELAVLHQLQEAYYTWRGCEVGEVGRDAISRWLEHEKQVHPQSVERVLTHLPPSNDRGLQEGASRRGQLSRSPGKRKRLRSFDEVAAALSDSVEDEAEDISVPDDNPAPEVLEASNRLEPIREPLETAPWAHRHRDSLTAVGVVGGSVLLAVLGWLLILPGGNVLVETQSLRTASGKLVRISSHPDALVAYRRAFDSYRRGELVESLVDVEIALEKDKQLAPAYDLRGRLLMRKGLSSQAIADFGQAVRMGLDDASYFGIRARAYLLEHDLEAAEQDVMRALEVDGADPDALVARALLQYYAGSFVDALADVKDDSSVTIDSAMALEVRAMLEFELSQMDAAIATCQRLVGFDKDNLLGGLLWVLASGPDPSVSDSENRVAILNTRVTTPIEYNYRAQLLMKLGGRDGEAITDLNHAIVMVPAYLIARLNRARCSLRQGDSKRAVLDLDVVIEARPDWAEAWALRAKARELEGRLEQAIVDLRAALRLDSEHPDYRRTVGTLALELSRFEDALNAFDEDLKVHPQSAGSMLGLARSLLFLGEYERAVETLQAAIRTEPELASFSFAEDLSKMPEREEASSRLAGLYLAVSARQRKLGENVAATLAASRAIELQPARAESYVARAWANIAQGRDREALEDLVQARAVQAGDAELLRLLANTADRLHEDDQAIEAYQALLDVSSGSADDYRDLGLLLLRSDHFERALEALDKTLALGDTTLETRLAHGRAHLLLGQLNPAIEDFSAILERNPEHPEALKGRGDAYAAGGHLGLASKDYTAGILQDSANIELRRARGMTYLGRGDGQAALADFDKAIELEPDNAENHFARGLALDQQGLLTAARAAFQRALELEPENEKYIDRAANPP